MHAQRRRAPRPRATSKPLARSDAAEAVGAGSVLSGKYRLLHEVARGSMGTIWQAEHVELGCSVAVKLIDERGRAGVEARARFLREARTAAALRSAHIVRVLDYGLDRDTPYLVMELLEGESLLERLSARGRLSRSETARVIGQLGLALGRAHARGVVHRDLSPKNVFLAAEDGRVVTKLLDFGIAKWFRAPGAEALTLTVRGMVLGTPWYMSPEQIDGGRELDARSDIWALGAIAFECLLGVSPFRAESFSQVVLAVCSRPLPVPSQHGPAPAPFDAWFARACAREPAERFESAEAAAGALRRLLRAPARGGPSRRPNAGRPSA